MIGWFFALVAGIIAAAGWIEAIHLHRVDERRRDRHRQAIADYGFTLADAIARLKNALARQADLAEENTRLDTLCDRAQASALELAGKLDEAQAIILQLESGAMPPTSDASPSEPEAQYYVTPAQLNNAEKPKRQRAPKTTKAQ